MIKLEKNRGREVMKCVVISGPKKLVIENREPKEGKQGYILIDVIKAGICGSDQQPYRLQH